MRLGRPAIVFSALATLVVPNVAGAQTTEPVSFVSCPVYRDVDVGPKSGCWLASDPASGIRYDIGAGRSKPQWGREVLVEGVVSQGADRCGGVVLKPVRVAVLESYCNKHMLPGEGYLGRAFELPKEVMQQSWVQRQKPQPPFITRDFVIFFGFNSSFPLYQHSEIILEKAALYANAGKPTRILVVGYAATDGIVVSGRELAENDDVARARAEKIALALKRLGVPSSTIDVKWQTSAEPLPGGDEGLDEPSKRRVVISIQF